MHLPHHQKLLQQTEADNLDSVIARIRAENPAAFHVEHDTPDARDTASTRVFMDQPVRPLPMKGFIRHYVAKAA